MDGVCTKVQAVVTVSRLEGRQRDYAGACCGVVHAEGQYLLRERAPPGAKNGSRGLVVSSSGKYD